MQSSAETLRGKGGAAKAGFGLSLFITCAFALAPTSCKERTDTAFYEHVYGSINQLIKTQDQLCQWPNKPRP